jgi:hypothetical protein
LRSLGITESALGAPVSACAESADLGETPGGLGVCVLRSALAVDAVLPVNRIKVHTAFHGEIESGLYKMLVVGLGGPSGAARFHGRGAGELSGLLLEAGDLILRKLPVAAGFAIVENAYERTALIRGVAPGDFRSEEPRILDLARSLMPCLPAGDLDALVIEEMGKNYSGTGIDTNVIGRMRIDGVPEPEFPSIRRVAVLDLSEESHGNANGIGLADLTTKRLADKIDRRATYLNCATTGFLNRGALPPHPATEREMMELLMLSLGSKRAGDVRLVQVHDTLNLSDFLVSEALVPDIEALPNAEVLGEPGEMFFDGHGNLTRRVGGIT